MIKRCGGKRSARSQRDAVSLLPLSQDGEKSFCVTGARRGSNNFEQHSQPQLCGCLIQALHIYSEIKSATIKK